MKCPSCQKENQADASFCSQCGNGLSGACPNCGRSVEPDAAFCSGCGRKLGSGTARSYDALPATPPHLAAKILRDRAALEGERRTVTVLFIDAVGSVSIGERLDQEELHRITREATQRMIAAVHRFEGTVAQFRGDGIMALFGAPIAHEDTARRAIAAAVAMRESLAQYDREMRAAGSSGFTYRIGLHTGPVIVGRIGDDLSMDYTAIGDTVNLAARMEQWAAPGTIYVTDQTRRMASGYFEFVDLGALEIKGKGEAVHAFEVERELGTRTRLDVATDRGLSPYVGRAHELSLLRRHFEEAKDGRGQVVFISGEAGMGKSRLMLEFRRSLEGEDFTWLTGQCISYGHHIPYLPIADLLKRNLGIEETDDDAAIVARIDERAESWEGAARSAAPYVKFLLNVDPGDARVATMDPMERRAGILDALRALLICGSSQRPVVMLIEDLHWIDEKSEEAIAALVDITAGSRVLMILTYRPGYAPSLGDRSYYNRVSLRHLPVEESDALLGGVLLAGTCPDEIRRLITSKAEGNPFYLEEVTKSLVESGMVRVTNGAYALTQPADQVRIPETIQEVILSRIDRLDHDAKDAIQLASVIGREFTARLLERMSEAKQRLDGLLDDLKNLELIYEKAYFPELSYMFKHALTHDVAYSTLLSDRRKALHRIVGAAVEELYADRLQEQYETLAHHYELAEDWPKARYYLAEAGKKAVAASANADAMDYFARALDAAQKPGHDVTAAEFAEIAIRRANVAMTIGDIPSALADAMLTVTRAHEAQDIASETRALTSAGMAQMWMHDFEAARDTLARARELADAGADDDAKFSAYVFSFEAEAILFGPAASGPFHGQAAALWEKSTDDLARGAYLADGTFIAQHWRGAYRQAVSEFAEHAPIIQAAPLNQWTIAHRWAEGLGLAHAGQYEAALRLLHEVLELSGRVGEVMFPPRALNSIGWVYGELQDHEAAIGWNERSAVAGRELGMPDPEIECNARLNWADSLFALGRFDEADEHFAFVGRVVQHPAPEERWMLWRYAQHYHHSFGELHLARGDAETALMLAEKCLRGAEETDARKNIVKARRLRGQARMALGDLVAAEEDVLAALDLAREIGNPGQLWKTHEALGDTRSARGQGDDARAAYTDALAVLDRVAASLADKELRSTLLASESARRLQRLTQAPDRV